MEGLTEADANHGVFEFTLSIATCKILAFEPGVSDYYQVGVTAQIEPSTHSTTSRSEATTLRRHDDFEAAGPDEVQRSGHVAQAIFCDPIVKAIKG